MANEVSSHQAYNRLIAILNEKQLGWIVAQVEDQIRLGKSATRRVKELKLKGYKVGSTSQLDDNEIILKPGREVEFRATEEYTADERLNLVLSAIRRAIVSTVAVGKAVTQHFPGLVFVSEQNDFRFAVSEFETEARLGAVDRLQHALNQLMSQLDQS